MTQAPRPHQARAFNIPENLRHKDVPDLTGVDEQHFAAIAASIDDQVATLTRRLDELRSTAARDGEAAMARDQQIRRILANLRTVRQYGFDLCLGRIVFENDGVIRYIGRSGLSDRSGNQLLIDWRTPAAEPFFAATHADPMGLASRRRFRWNRGRVVDYWDEVFTDSAFAHTAALDDQSAFIATLGASRSPRMRDVLGTIQSDQNAIIRAGSRGTLVVDGGPGTGKTVVALHRAAYLLYSDPRLGHHRGGVLVVGPHKPYLAYVSDILPSLGEEGVQTCTLRQLVPEGEAAGLEADPQTADLKAQRTMAGVVESAVRFYEEPPTAPLEVDTAWATVRITPTDWAAAFDAAEPGIPHNEARDVIWQALLHILLDKHDGDVPLDALRRDAAANHELTATFNAAWPLLHATDVIADLWSVPAYLRRCAPWLTTAEVRALQRSDPYAWTEHDLPFLDAARQRLGDPDAAKREQHKVREEAARRAEMSYVIDDLIAADDSRCRSCRC
ncbi:MAG: RNA polymerase recycling motor ATPase HelR [Cumulibacter sp.]